LLCKCYNWLRDEEALVEVVVASTAVTPMVLIFLGDASSEDEVGLEPASMMSTLPLSPPLPVVDLASAVSPAPVLLPN
jgi:hypothetical protein